jgi:hypothetical protein
LRIAIAVKLFVMEAMGNGVVDVNGFFASTSRRPNPVA